ncbi:hypothetical protein V6N13_054768 [Hibiscus sabdariffa]
MKTLCSLIPLLFLSSCFLSLSQTHLPKHYCLDDQRSPLLQLQTHLYSNFTFSSKFELWDLHTDCCSWEGVSCDSLGHVIGLDLSYRNLSGSFHSIFHLHHLRRLNLAGNNFNTTLLSYEFDKLPNLTHLNLSSSCFHGQIPMEISYLTRLVSLDLSYQDDCYWRNADYDFPTLKLEKPNFKTLMKNLKFLRQLYLDGVNISTHSSKWCETTSLVLSNLQVLSLSNCGLEGPLCSSLSRLPFLSKLVLDYNPISYLPPNFLENSSHLVSLSLVSCDLSGHFPTEIFLLPKIQSIDLSYNEKLMGQFSEFPSNNALQSLSLSDTNFSGKLPESIGNLKFLKDLTLDYCKFYGTIPWSVANLSRLVKLDLSDNNFSGSIPPFHPFGVPNLAHLNLESNKLSGSIHSSLFTLPSLRTLSLIENQFVGKIDEFPNASSSLIEGLHLGNEYLSGPIPKSIFQLRRLEELYIYGNGFGSMKFSMFFQLNNLRFLSLFEIILLIESDNKSLTFPQLDTLYLSSCNLTEFPEFIKTQDKLVELDLSNNHIQGVVPNWLWKSTLSWVDLSLNPIDFPKQFPFGDANFSLPMLTELRMGSCNISAFPEFLKSLENLKTLDLPNNTISGAIPNWVWKKSLRDLNLANNHLSSLDQLLPNQSSTSSQGSPTAAICNMSKLRYFDASYNNLSGLIPNCLGNMSALTLLNLQGNNFSGALPEFSKANQLQFLIVSDNRLERKLPRSLAKCTQLEYLDVGDNMIHDAFPFWLEELTALTVLILRKNKFYGRIKYFKNKVVFPTLDVLDIASNEFSGELSINLFQATQLRSLKIEEDEEDSWLDAMSTLQIILVGYASGLVAGICIGYTVLNELGNKWVDKLYLKQGVGCKIRRYLKQIKLKQRSITNNILDS